MAARIGTAPGTPRVTPHRSNLQGDNGDGLRPCCKKRRRLDLDDGAPLCSTSHVDSGGQSGPRPRSPSPSRGFPKRSNPPNKAPPTEVPRADCPLLDPHGVNYSKSQATVRVTDLAKGEFRVELSTAQGPRAYRARMLPPPTQLEGDDAALTWLGEHMMALVTLAHRGDPEFAEAKFSLKPQAGTAKYAGALQGKASKQLPWDLGSPVPAEEASSTPEAARKVSSTTYAEEITRLIKRMREILKIRGPVRVRVSAE